MTFVGRILALSLPEVRDDATSGRRGQEASECGTGRWDGSAGYWRIGLPSG
jgi:hypothetical protein